jgi:large subunit ribosomal protein L24e
MDCNFCGDRIPRGTEFIYVTNKGKALYFCASKCKKNLVNLNRKPRETKWTQAYKQEKEARLKIIGQKPPQPAKAAEEAKPKAQHAQEHKEKKADAKAKSAQAGEAHPKEAKPKEHAQSHEPKKETKKPKK